MSKQIFRQAAVDRLSTPENLDQAIRVTSPMGWFAAVVFIGFVCGGLVWGVVGSVPIKVAGQGILISPSGVLDIVSASQGRIRDFQVRPGEHVKEGEVVAHIEQPDMRQKLVSKTAELAEFHLQLEQVKAFHQREMDIQLAVLRHQRSNLSQSIGFVADRLKWLQERAVNEANLQKKATSSGKRLSTQKSKSTPHAKRWPRHATKSSKSSWRKTPWPSPRSVKFSTCG
ncbi:MAG: hypothetical protein JKY27_07775 [Magnetovibrio sp.]|nr:hypothetical protein [Magnetovibrio sp.]